MRLPLNFPRNEAIAQTLFTVCLACYLISLHNLIFRQENKNDSDILQHTSHHFKQSCLLLYIHMRARIMNELEAASILTLFWTLNIAKPTTSEFDANLQKNTGFK